MLESALLNKRKDEIRKLYLADEKPWIIGYSGGKDSTATLQLVYSAISELPDNERNKKVWVITSDTLVEIPTVVKRLDRTLERVNEKAKLDGMPFEAKKVSPDVDSSFFVNLIGRGYPSPTRNFRWCTDRLKIKPTSKFIESQISTYGEVIIILGARTKESMSRAQAMENYSIKGSVLKRHTSLPSAYVYTPIEDWGLEDVWTYLLQVESPWGENNRELVTLYRKAGGDECPLVVDTSTPSCGNSRFGCWVCTVVEQDKSIHGFIESGESWLEPMADFRDLIKEMREEREEYRIKDEKRIGGYGPFTIQARQLILEKLLNTEKACFETHQEKLINSEELWAIQQLWFYDGADKFAVKKLYKKVYGDIDKLNHNKPDIQQTGIEEDIHLLNLCEDKSINNDLLQKLIHIESDYTKMRRKVGLYERLDAAFSNAIEWDKFDTE